MSKKFAWSYSAMKTFLTCPRKYHAEKVEKLYPFVETEAVRYGNVVHKVAEDFIGKGKPIPDGHKQFASTFERVKAMPGTIKCEFKMALNADREPTSYFARDVKLRGVADVYIRDGAVAKVIDWKTGKANYPDPDQLELMAMMINAHAPEAEEIKSALVFLLHKKAVRETYTSEDMDRLWKKWAEREYLLQTAYDNDVWEPKPNGLCRAYCPVEHCEHNGRN